MKEEDKLRDLRSHGPPQGRRPFSVNFYLLCAFAYYGEDEQDIMEYLAQKSEKNLEGLLRNQHTLSASIV